MLKNYSYWFLTSLSISIILNVYSLLKSPSIALLTLFRCKYVGLISFSTFPIIINSSFISLLNLRFSRILLYRSHPLYKSFGRSISIICNMSNNSLSLICKSLISSSCRFLASSKTSAHAPNLSTH